MNSILIYLEIL